MLQHLVFEDEFEARRRSGDGLLAVGLLDEVVRWEDALVRGGALGGANGGDGGGRAVVRRHFCCCSVQAWSVKLLLATSSALDPLPQAVTRQRVVRIASTYPKM